jgi:subtilisin family serine protease
MKTIITLLFVILSFQITAQVAMSSQTLHELKRIEQVFEEQQISKHLIETELSNLPIYKVNGQYCISALLRVEPSFNKTNYHPKFYYGKKIGSCITVKIPLRYVNQIALMEAVNYIEIAERIQPENNKMTRDVRADSVWNGFNLPKGFTGKNVLIGVTDWGFDYTHPMFMDTALSKTRIRAAWDHFKQTGAKPTGFNYGVAYQTPSELAAAQSDTAGTYYDYATHGSHVAGIAAGSGAGIGYRGVAFEAEFLFNSIQLDVGAAIDAFTWMQEIAQKDKKRLVINMSWGLYYLGTMDGTSILSEVIEEMSKEGVVFVTSGGNNGGVNFHIKKDFNNDSLRSRISFYGYSLHPSMWGQSISMWGLPNKPFAAGFEVYNSANVKLGSSRIYTTLNGSNYIDTFMVINNDTILYNLSIENAHPQNNRPHIRMRIKNTNTQLQVVLVSAANSGTVHYWNVVELSNGVGNWGQSFSIYGTHGVNGDANYGIGEPACAPFAITVAAHTSENVLTNGNLNPGNRASFSSRGPTYDERIKPDVSAPGVNVVSSINSFTSDDFTSVASTNFNGRIYHFAAFSGTSMASPAAAGVVALMLEANPLLSAAQVKSILRSTARQDNRTGPITAPGSPLWGMGRVTANSAIALALSTSSLKEIRLNNLLTVYPNPAQNYLQVVAQNKQTLAGNYEIFDLQGKRLEAGPIEKDGLIYLEELKSGVFVLKVIEGETSYTTKFIKE